MVLCDHITNNALNLQSISMLNKIEKHFITPPVAFTQIFQLKGYGKYGMQVALLMFLQM
jgi:hypothetical protein